MKLLALHNNSPAQFKYLLQYAKKHHDYEIVFCSLFSSHATDIYKTEIIQDTISSRLTPLEKQFQFSQIFYKKMSSLRSSHYRPDIILSHSGWGCGLYAKHLFPFAKLVCYHEWWFKEAYLDPDLSHLESTDKESFCSLYQRNSLVALELSNADLIITPTRFQRDSLPKCFQANTLIIHEGTDVNYYRYNPAFKCRSGSYYLTYATRGMEPIRGFEYFVRALPSLLKLNTDIRIIIAGEDNQHYGGSGSKKDFKYGQWAKSFIDKHGLRSRVNFCGRLDQVKYARLLKMSYIHYYFSKAFVPSWSLVDAMASGCRIIATKIPPVIEILGDSELLIDHTCIDKVIQSTESILSEESHEYHAACEASRSRAKTLFDSDVNARIALAAIESIV